MVTLFLLAAGASAALGNYWVRRVRVRDTAPAAIADRTVAQLPPRTRVSPASSIETSEPDTTTTPVVTDTQPVAVDARAARADPLPHSDSTPRAPQASERVLVFDAMRLLRREGQPARAARLLDEYLRRYPRGFLAEEALALSIEAATASGDSRASALAERYLKRYPDGRFRSAALRARDRFAP